MAFLQVADDGHRRILTIRRPERLNALGTKLADELLLALDEARTLPPQVRMLVITAEPVITGSACTWIAGGDLKELNLLKNRSDVMQYADKMRRFCRGLDELAVPVIVAVDGAAIGGGAELALAGDLRFATRRSYWDFKQLKVGLPTGYGSAARLVQLLGLARAQALLYQCQKLTAEQALSFGLVSAVAVDATALRALLAQACSELASLAPEALLAQKRMLKAATFAATDQLELEAFCSAWRNPTHTQFLERYGAKDTP